MARPGGSKNSTGAPPVPFKKLYTYATKMDIFMVVLSCIAAVASGTILPLFSLVFGSALNILNDPTSSIVDAVSKLALYFLLIAIGAGFLSFAQVSLTVMTAERQMMRLRSAYVKALLYLDATWYDTHRAGEAVARLAEATITISTGMEKLPSVLQYTATLITGLVIGFTTSWKLSLVIAACAPLFAIALSILIITAISAEKAERNAYARAGDAANETFSLIRSIAAYSGENHESSRYLVFLRAAEKAGIRKGVGIGTAVGLMLVSFYAMYGISTWAGAQFVIQSREDMPICRYYPNTDDCFSGGDIITTFVSVLLGALSFGQIGPLMGNISAARAAAADIYGIIDAKPAIVSKPNGYQGKSESASTGVLIEFKNVTFAYPSRPDVQILKNFSLTIQPGEIIGIAGSSGSGKSTLSLLILRAYDPQEGDVFVDGVNVKDWDLFSLRSMIGLVQQDPILFGVTIGENIGMGKPSLNGPATTEEISNAAKSANAENFILNLPQQYNTMAGTGVSGTQLSGGQRQRICIARAIMRQPRLLLLDEATSALDTHSERIVQKALDNLSNSNNGRSRTTIQVAHRLSTLLSSDRILVMQHGVIVEEGKPSELLSKPEGIFRSMKAAQDIEDPTKGTNSNENEKQRRASVSSEASVEEDKEKSITNTTDSTETTKNTELVIRVVDKEPSASTSSGSVSKSTVAPIQTSAPVKNLRERIWSLQEEDALVLFLGILGALGSGCIQPIVSIVYGDIIAIFFVPDDNAMKEKSLHYLGWFFLLGAGAFVGVMCRVSVFTYLGERLTRKLRSLAYTAILRQPQAFFDQQENSVGRLGTRLATDASLVKGATGDALGSLLEAAGAIICAVVIAFIASWRLALVLMIVFPFLIIGSIYEFRSVAQVSRGGNKALEDAGNSVAEAVTAIRTVTAYNLQTSTLKVFDKALESPYKTGIKRGFVQGSGQGFQRFMLMCAYSLAFYAGSRFIDLGWLQFPELIRTFLAVTLAAEAVGRISSQAPDTAKADAAARAIFALIDSGNNSSIDPLSTKGENPLLSISDGTTTTATNLSGLKIEFKNVTFAYPSRPDVQVLKNFNLVINPGETVGIVGSSGSGKSTLSLLIQRAYDPQEGAILVNDVDVRDWNVTALRSTIGLVQQEPALFADSIAYNIAYGTSNTTKMAAGLGVQPKETSDNTTTDSTKKDSKDEKSTDTDTTKKPTTKGTKSIETETQVIYPPPPTEVIEAATYANAINFITELPDSFATYCGSRGTQLSGGQKQRIAIARALLRKPRLLLLDEATSALDSESERIVQEALDKILAESQNKDNKTDSVGRTSLVIAHRLSTLANTNRIIVLDKGKVVESGTHNELMNIKDGHYRTLALAQQGVH